MNAAQLMTTAPGKVVALSTQGALDQAAFWRRVHGLSAAISVQRARRWALVCEDSSWFAAGLLALGNAGRNAILPQAPQAGSLAVSGAHVDAVLTDRPAAFTGHGYQVLSAADVAPADLSAARWPDDTALIESYTSGSSGMPKCVVKAFAQLRHEVQTLEREWGVRLGDTLVVGTVPHHHLYGLLVRVLWPLMAGRCFVTQTCVHPGELRDWSQSQRCVIVSSPAFLGRIADVAELPAASQIAAVFSSGAPLPDASAERLQRDWGHAPIEIYGSTETGGIGWRAWSGAAERALWKLINGVQIELREEAAGARLWVKSGFTWRGDWMATGDLAQLHADGRFTLLGRADDVVKFEDKRLSLSEMRTRLEAHAWVESARMLVLQGRRPLIGAAVILNAAGREQLVANGKRGVSAALRTWLRAMYEPILIPRKWRFPEALPGNDMGKVVHSSLQRLFEERS